MRVSYLIPLTATAVTAFAADASAQAMVREQKVITSAGARAMADACTAWRRDKIARQRHGQE